MQFLILFAQAHPTFRICELQALAELNGIEVDLSSNHREETPFMVVELKNCDEARKLVERSILTRAVYELYGSGSTIESLHSDIRQKNHNWEQYKTCSFKFDFESYNGSRSRKQQLKLIESFAYLNLDGPIRMKNPDEVFTVLEDYEETHGKEPSEFPRQIWFGRYICDGSRRLMDDYDLKKRKYIGTTSFDAELALVSCNIALVDSGKWMYDPFAGTGSFLVAASHFGALSVGSDIDPRMLRGKGDATIEANFKQYNLYKYFVDVIGMDFTHNAFRPDLKLDAIVCDPPYGVREGLKVLGSKDPEKVKDKEPVKIDGVDAHLLRDYIFPKKPYQFNSLLDDLLQFGADSLVERGRLCFWMPTANDDFVPNDIPLHPDLELVGNCVQEFNKWSRRLLVYRRRKHGERGDGYSVKGKSNEEFRDKYFRGFTKNE